MAILWPDAVGDDKLRHMDVDEARVLEPRLQFDSRADLVTSLLECAVDFVIVPFKPGVFEAAVFRERIAVPVLEFNPATGFD